MHDVVGAGAPAQDNAGSRSVSTVSLMTTTSDTRVLQSRIRPDVSIRCYKGARLALFIDEPDVGPTQMPDIESLFADLVAMGMPADFRPEAPQPVPDLPKAVSIGYLDFDGDIRFYVGSRRLPRAVACSYLEQGLRDSLTAACRRAEAQHSSTNHGEDLSATASA